jgi:phosphatidylserine decarboxylase
MDLLTSNALLRSYFLLPHRLLNRSFSRLAMRSRPAWAVQAAIRAWTHRSQLDLRDFEEGPFATVQEFFLRRLREGARPLQAGLCSPVDGEVFAAGALLPGTTLVVKGQRLSVERLVNGRAHRASLSSYEGGHYVAIFLSPRGYHHIHMPVAGRLLRCQWLAGRYFPQNAVALRHIPAVYERNERAVLFCAAPDAGQFILVLVGASLVGGIHLADVPVERWRHGQPTELDLQYDKGQRLAHFSFGSTVVLLFPRGSVQRLVVEAGDAVRMGQPLGELNPLPDL